VSEVERRWKLEIEGWREMKKEEIDGGEGGFI
jgi:hypothetical protein